MVSRRVGGAAQVAIALARAASERGWRSQTWVPGPGPASKILEAEKLPHRTIELEATDTSTVHRVLTCGRLVLGLGRERRAIVHVHSTWMFGLIRPALSAAGARTIVHFHTDPDPPEIAWALKRPPAHLITCARYIERRLRSEIDRLGLATGVTAIPNAVDLERLVPGDRLVARGRLGLCPPDRFVILMLANLSPHKGQSTAVRALHALTRRGVRAELWIAGENRTAGTYEHELHQLAAGLGVTADVRFLGFRSDAPLLLQAANVFLLPSAIEGLPLSVLEAQAAGVPVVGSNIPGMLEIIEDGVTGFTLATDDVDGYADRLFAIHERPELAHRLTEAAGRRVRQEHAWKAYEERTFGVYAAVGERLS